MVLRPDRDPGPLLLTQGPKEGEEATFLLTEAQQKLNPKTPDFLSRAAVAWSGEDPRKNLSDQNKCRIATRVDIGYLLELLKLRPKPQWYENILIWLDSV